VPVEMELKVLTTRNESDSCDVNGCIGWIHMRWWSAHGAE
jgi:hypothetical protein